jgi:polysaccharide chain length determinant protein (PEP-CTERM system associated)
MQDVLKLVHTELRGAWRYRWQALAVAWVVSVLGWLAVYLTPDTYEARARFYLDTSSALEPFVRNLSVGLDVDQQVDLVKQLVVGRDGLLKVARETDLDIGARAPVELEAILEKLAASIQLKGGGPAPGNPRLRDRNYSIAYRDTDRQRAVKVVQVVLDNFIENTLEKRNIGFQSAQDFLRRQIQQQEQRLTEAEQKLADFKRRNINNLPTQEGSYITSLQNEMAALRDLQSQQRVLHSRRSQLSAQLAAERQYVPSSSLPAAATAQGQAVTGGNETDRAILQMQTRLDELLRVYTPKHPEVVALEENLKLLREQRREELARMGVTDLPERGGMVANPVWEQIRLQRNQVDVDLAAVGGQIAERAARVSEMRSKMETMPEVEAELAQLNRDYDVLRERYGLLLQQLESAKLSENVGQTEQVEFSIIEPPTALASPVAPPRLLLLIGVLVMGLGAGGAAAFALSKLNPIFDSLSTLEAATGLPVLGAVSVTWLDRRKARRRTEMLRVAAVGAALLVVFVVVLAARDAGSHYLTGLMG